MYEMNNVGPTRFFDYSYNILTLMLCFKAVDSLLIWRELWFRTILATSSWKRLKSSSTVYSL